jgi:hypothetical protein
MSRGHIVFLFFATWTAGVGIYGIATGSMPMRFGKNIERIGSPVSFWFVAFAYGFICAVCIHSAFLG